MNKFLKILVAVSIPLLVGSIAGLATTPNIKSWYMYLNKPVFSPPNWIFGPMWSLLYILMGVGLYLIWESEKGGLRTRALKVFFIQLAFNFAWSFIFFEFRLIGVAFFEIILVWISVLAMILTFYPVNKKAALLQIPYILWVTFASALNGAIWILNK
ncbi:MAG: tryptophan-rich sensory protein [Ignavibacteria bacterium]|nr:tryptophan-rich sensory protein [Ignavibacteria bacterium]